MSDVAIAKYSDAQATKRSGQIIVVNGTHFAIWEEHVDEAALRLIFRSLVARLRTRGFAVMRDPEVERNYPSIAASYWVGRKGDLEFHAEAHGRMACVEFFQNLNVDNPNGGRYDFNKLERMPGQMRRQCIVELTALVRRALELGYHMKVPAAAGKPLMLHIAHLARGRKADSLLDRFNESWGANRFQRGDNGWPTADELGYCWRKDRDGVPVQNGDLRYFWHLGRINRSRVWGGINGQWMVMSGSGVWHVHSGELFSCDPTALPRRFVPGQRERLVKEIAHSTKASDWKRVARLAVVLGKLSDSAL